MHVTGSRRIDETAHGESRWGNGGEMREDEGQDGTGAAARVSRRLFDTVHGSRAAARRFWASRRQAFSKILVGMDCLPFSCTHSSLIYVRHPGAAACAPSRRLYSSFPRHVPPSCMSPWTARLLPSDPGPSRCLPSLAPTFLTHPSCNQLPSPRLAPASITLSYTPRPSSRSSSWLTSGTLPS